VEVRQKEGKNDPKKERTIQTRKEDILKGRIKGKKEGERVVLD
jgi:hypothetical protein